jgi:hypothetical protein
MGVVILCFHPCCNFRAFEVFQPTVRIYEIGPEISIGNFANGCLRRMEPYLNRILSDGILGDSKNGETE